MGGFGLTIGINADPSQAQAAIAGLKTSLDQAVEATQTAGEGMSRNFINAHQSVHLLAEEMGIHLPRAVVGAVSEMLPQITDLGNALRGDAFVAELKRADFEFNFDMLAAIANLQKLCDVSKLAGSQLTELDVRFHTVNLGVAQMNTSMRDYLGQISPAIVVTEQLALAQKLEALAASQVADQFAGEIARIAELIAGRRAAAAVLAIWNTAKAAEEYAEFFISGDPQYLAAALQNTLAAVQYGLVAGSGGGVAGAAGGGGASARGLAPRAGAGYGYGPGGSSPGVAPGALAPGSAPAPGGQLTVMVMGEPTAAQWLTTNVLNPFVQRGGTLMASTAQRVPASSG